MKHMTLSAVPQKVWFEGLLQLHTNVFFMTMRYCFLYMKEENLNYISSEKEGESFSIVYGEQVHVSPQFYLDNIATPQPHHILHKDSSFYTQRRFT